MPCYIHPCSAIDWYIPGMHQQQLLVWSHLADQKVGECGYSFASLFFSNTSSSVSVLLSVSFLSWSLSSCSSGSWWSCNDLYFLNDFETVVVPLALRLFTCLVSASVKSLSSTMRVSLSMTLIWWSMLQQFLDTNWPLKETMHVWSLELGKNVRSAWQRRTFSFGSGGWFLSCPEETKQSQSSEPVAPLFWVLQVQKCFLLLSLESTLEGQGLHHIWLTYLKNFAAFSSLFLLSIGSPLLRVSLQIVHWFLL